MPSSLSFSCQQDAVAFYSGNALLKHGHSLLYMDVKGSKKKSFLLFLCNRHLALIFLYSYVRIFGVQTDGWQSI